jgi:exodeoxyribonuclease V beta subunit
MNAPDLIPLRPLRFPLHGARLIEASAGTGKTWTIAALYLRLVLGHGPDGVAFPGGPLRPDQILVMTFTRAATRELSDRIRARLLEAAQAFRTDDAASSQKDPLLAELFAAYPPGSARSQAAHRLALAAEGMDDAAIHTIDAWCQRMLREHAFDSGNLFDEELLPDEQHLLTQAVQDYWRQQCYPLTAAQLGPVLGVWANVEALLSDIRNILGLLNPHQAEKRNVIPVSLGACLGECQTQRQQRLTELKAGWAERAEVLRDWVVFQTEPKVCPWDRRKLSAANVRKWMQTVIDWAQDPDAETLALSDAAWHRIRPEGIAEAWKGKGVQPALPEACAAFVTLAADLAGLPSLAPALRLHAAQHIAQRLEELKRQSGHFGFADLLVRLDTALQSESGERLRQRILTQTPVALIDEFQDTSALQYRIFDRLYRVAELDGQGATPTALLLIGDPKQSIYRFRGADIASYLAARRATAGRHYVLDTNYRSTQAVVQAINHCFAQAEQRPGAGAFGYRAVDDDGVIDNPLPFVTVAAQGRAEQFLHAGAVQPALTLVHALQLAPAETHLRHLAELCAAQIVTWLNEAHTGFAVPGDSSTWRRLRPADIAVLVRTGREARAIKRALERRRVASVYLSDRESVFNSDEAGDLLHLLRAVAQPLDSRLVRAALATRTLGLSLAQLAQLAADDEAFDKEAEKLRELHGVWQRQGVLTLLRQVLHRYDLPARWLDPQADPGGERRLTNFLHLAELLQSASRELDGEQALIRWLTEQCEAAAAGQVSGDEQVVRLESDADLVKVVTIHKSKGLEYPVVCLPFAVSFRPEAKGHTTAFAWLDEHGQRQLRLDIDDELIARADAERLREDVRLLYVALTRARHALWLGFAALTVGNSKECQTHRSAAGHLLTHPDATDADTLAQMLARLAQGCPDIALQPAPEERPPLVPLTRREQAANLTTAQTYNGQFDRTWGIASFSSLVRAMTATHTVAHAPRPADDEPPAPEFPSPEGEGPGMRWHRFERGPLAGNFLHEQLEWLAHEAFALTDDSSLAERLRRRCERAGRGAQADDVIAWLSAWMHQPLTGPGVPLPHLHRLLPEMEFWLPAAQLPAATVDALCRRHLLRDLAPEAPRPTLVARELHGLVMGFADLVFEHDGRYWVLDYKSNQLGPEGSAYTAAALTEAMALHRYDVQAALYLLALHRLLRQRLGDAYDPATQLGGAIYLFLRGLDGPAQGQHLVLPDLALLDALDALLTQEATA